MSVEGHLCCSENHHHLWSTVIAAIRRRTIVTLSPPAIIHASDPGADLTKDSILSSTEKASRRWWRCLLTGRSAWPCHSSRQSVCHHNAWRRSNGTQRLVQGDATLVACQGHLRFVNPQGATSLQQTVNVGCRVSLQQSKASGKVALEQLVADYHYHGDADITNEIVLVCRRKHAVPKPNGIWQ